VKTAMLRARARPEPYYWLGVLSDNDGDARQATHYYDMALDVSPTFRPAREALMKLGRIRPER
jgi:TolA-binding protein